jgi:hypothetical protein
MGSCMVSSEGACAAHWTYGRFRDIARGQRMKKNKTYPRKLDIKNGRVDLSHGSGGRAMAQLIDELFHARLRQRVAARSGNDQAAFDVAGAAW